MGPLGRRAYRSSLGRALTTYGLLVAAGWSSLRPPRAALASRHGNGPDRARYAPLPRCSSALVLAALSGPAGSGWRWLRALDGLGTGDCHRKRAARPGRAGSGSLLDDAVPGERPRLVGYGSGAERIDTAG